MQKKIVALFLITVLSVYCVPLWAQEPKEQAEQFLSDLMKGDVETAYDTIFAGTKMAELKPQAVSGLKTQTKSVFPLYGTPFAYEIIHNENLSPSLQRIVYILKFDLTPTTWEFYFYKARDKWTLNKITFYDQFQNIAPMK